MIEIIKQTSKLSLDDGSMATNNTAMANSASYTGSDLEGEEIIRGMGVFCGISKTEVTKKKKRKSALFGGGKKK